jgi:hypothetical protein
VILHRWKALPCHGAAKSRRGITQIVGLSGLEVPRIEFNGSGLPAALAYADIHLNLATARMLQRAPMKASQDKVDSILVS